MNQEGTIQTPSGPVKVRLERSLWCILDNEHQRDGYDLRPLVWKGAGEYMAARILSGDRKDERTLVKISASYDFDGYTIL